MTSDLWLQILAEYEKHGTLSQTFLMRRFRINSVEAQDWMNKFNLWLVQKDKK